MSFGERIVRGTLFGFSGLRRSLAPPTSLGIRPIKPQLPVFLCVEWSAPVRQEGEELVAELQPGESYNLTVRISPKPQGGDEAIWHLQGDQMVLSLSCPSCPEIALSAIPGVLDSTSPDHATVRLGRFEIEQGVEVDFLLEVPPRCPQCVGWLHFLCSNGETRFPTSALSSV